MIGFDPFHLIGGLLTQPVEVKVAGRLGTTFSFNDGQTLYEKATNRRGFHLFEGAGHYDVYDKEPYIGEAVDKLDDFSEKHLSTA